MAADVFTAQDAVLLGMSKFNIWKRKFTEKWEKPAVDMAKVSLWQSLPPEQVQIIHRDKPDLYKRMTNLSSGGK